MVAVMPAIARITAFSHRGRVRARNEDTIAVGGWLSEPEMAAPRAFRHALTAPLLCAVCDGMGGHRAGDVASRQVARRLAERQARLADARTAAAALKAIDAELYRAMQADVNLLGMGTTVVGLMLAPRLVWFNVGDSRLYRHRDGRIWQMSIDDTPAGPRSGLLTQSLGGALPPPGIAPHVGEDDLPVPARFLLCSDGLTDMLGDDDIEDCLKLSDADAVAQLFELTMRAGGSDNISIVVASVEGEARAAAND
jgi:PPM family protein phosphatase